MADPRALANLCETRARSSGKFDVYRDNGPETTSRNYIVLHFPAGDAFRTRNGGGQSDLRWSFRVVCVGLDGDARLWVVQLVRALFRNWHPVPAEEFTSWLEEENDEAPPIRDDTVPGDIRYSLTLRYTLTTRS